MTELAKFLFLFLISIFIFASPLIAKANVLYLDCYAQKNCDLCDAIQLATKISKFVLSAAGSLSLLIFVIAGIILLTSQGVPGRIESGKKMIYSGLIGILIVYFAWVGVNFVLYSFAGGEQTGQSVATVFSKPWNKLECVKMDEIKYVEEQTETTEPGSGACGADIGVSCGGNCGGIKIADNINSKQCDDASIKKIGSDLDKLTELLTCINNKKNNYTLLINKELVITSISDDTGLDFCRSSTYSRPPCAHSKNSCHYGGPFKYTEGSYAADFRSISSNPRQNFNSNEQVAFKKLVMDECGGQFLWETDHFHVSVPSCGGL